jgi:hypothetical protein
MEREAKKTLSWREQFQEAAARLSQPIEALRQLLGDVVARAVAATGAAGGSVLVPDDDGRQLRFLVSRGPAAEKLQNLKLPLEASIAGHVYSTGAMMAFGDLHAEDGSAVDEEASLQSAGPIHTYLVLPILHNGRAHGVATYVNRAGTEQRPFQPDEMERARSYTLLESAVLRHLERLRQLDRFGAYDLAVAWVALDPQGPDPKARPDLRGNAEPWVRLLGHLEQLGQEDQDFCADLIGFVARRRNWELG